VYLRDSGFDWYGNIHRFHYQHGNAADVTTAARAEEKMPIFATCPSCQTKLEIPEILLGKKVRCASCSTVFEAHGESPVVGEATHEPLMPVGSTPPPLDRPRPGRERHEWDDDEDRADHDDDPPEGRYVRRDLEPHRGGLILAMGIICIVTTTFGACCYGLPTLLGAGLGIAAWIMARGDLRKMAMGSMDSDGEGQTKAGMICSIVGCVLGVLIVICCFLYIAVMIALTSTQQTFR
jgi:hypothetical protein